jgi:hypothetical protein
MRVCRLCGQNWSDDVLECYGWPDRSHEAVLTESLDEPPPPPPDQVPDPVERRADLLVTAADNYRSGAFAATAYVAECQAIIDGQRD